jgi:hypothetical protein
MTFQKSEGLKENLSLFLEKPKGFIGFPALNPVTISTELSWLLTGNMGSTLLHQQTENETQRTNYTTFNSNFFRS